MKCDGNENQLIRQTTSSCCARPTHARNNQVVLQHPYGTASNPHPVGVAFLPSASLLLREGPSPTGDHGEFERKPHPTAITVTPPNQLDPWFAQQPLC